MNQNLQKYYSKKQVSGFAMIEVLISVVILSVSLLGLAGLQVVGMKGTQHAVMTTQASLLTQRLSEKIRANPNGDYGQAIDCSLPIPRDCAVNICNANQLAAYDLYRIQCGTQLAGGQWLGGVGNTLMNGKVQVACGALGAGSTCTITTTWDEQMMDKNEVSATGTMPKVLTVTMTR